MRNRVKVVGVINRGGGLEKIVKKDLTEATIKKFFIVHFCLWGLTMTCFGIIFDSEQMF